MWREEHTLARCSNGHKGLSSLGRRRVAKLGARLATGNSGKARGVHWLLSKKLKSLDTVNLCPRGQKVLQT